MARKRDKTVWVESEGPTGYIRPTTRLEVVANMLEAIRRDTFTTREAFLDKRLIEDVTGAPRVERDVEDHEIIGFTARDYGPGIEDWTVESRTPRSEPFNCYVDMLPIRGTPTVEYCVKVGTAYEDLEFDRVKDLLPEPWEVEDPLTVLRSPPHPVGTEVIVNRPVTGKYGDATTFHHLATRGRDVVRCRLEWTAEGTLWFLFARKALR